MNNVNLSEPSNKINVPNKTEDVDLSVFKKEEKKESKSCECNRKFDDKRYNSNQIQNINKCGFECKVVRKNVCKKGYASKAAKCTFKNGKYLSIIINGSVIMHDKITETGKPNLTKTAPAKSTPIDFNKKYEI